MSELHMKLAALARDMGAQNYELLSEDDKAPIAFGMGPLHVMEEFEAKFRKMVAEGFVSHPDSLLYGLDAEVAARNLDKDLIREANKSFYLGLMDGAKANDALLV